MLFCYFNIILIIISPAPITMKVKTNSAIISYSATSMFESLKYYTNRMGNNLSVLYAVSFRNYVEDNYKPADYRVQSIIIKRRILLPTRNPVCHVHVSQCRIKRTNISPTLLPSKKYICGQLTTLLKQCKLYACRQYNSI